MEIRIFENVQLNKPYIVEDFVIIGKPVKHKQLDTSIDSHSVIRSHTVIYAGNIIGINFQTGHHVLIRESNKIGANVSIGSSTVIEHHTVIGNHVRIHSQAFVPEYSVLEEGCWIGPNVVLTNAKYPLSLRVKDELLGPIIKRNAKVGANATILPGVTIGENALVGAGSVVTKDVAPNSVVIGNPACLVNDISNLPYELADETTQ